jgi:hypothetical protein
MSKKKKKKKKQLRLKQLKALEQKGKAGQNQGFIQKEPIISEKAEVRPEPIKKEIKENTSGFNIFRGDLKRLFIIIVICLIILVSLYLIFQYTNLALIFNNLLPK